MIEEITDKNIDNLDNFRFNLQHLFCETPYKNFEVEIEKQLLLEKDEKKTIKNKNNLNFIKKIY